MKISFSEFCLLDAAVPVIIHSLDQALYQVTVEKGGREYLLVENNQRTFRRHSLNEVREALRNMPIASLVLRQRSAYDEMIGQVPREAVNTLEIPLSLDLYPPVTTH